MLKLKLVCLAVTLIALLLPGCTDSEPAIDQIPVDTEFGRMFDMIPYSLFEEYEPWFSNPREVKRIYGYEHINSFEAMTDLPEEESRRWADSFRELRISFIAGIKNEPRWMDLFGFRHMMADVTIFVDQPPSGPFTIMEGDFDKELIASKLNELGYEEVEYGSYSYHSIRYDYGIDIESEAGRLTISTMNRVAVLDGMIITAPATDIITGILDAMAGNVDSVMDNIACRALADSMGEVVSGILITPERLLNRFPGHGDMPPFDFVIPEDWGMLHQYDMIGMGYKDDGKERYWVISIYYPDKDAASEDADELVKRMNDYTFSRLSSITNFGESESIIRKLTDWVEVGEPVIREYPGGSTLTVECRYLEGGHGSFVSEASLIRDYLFLAPDPSLAKEEYQE